jgi:hypothetical protein
MTRNWALATGLFVLAVACLDFQRAASECEDGGRCALPPGDGGGIDAGAPDGGAADAASADAGLPDGGAADSGAADAGDCCLRPQDCPHAATALSLTLVNQPQGVAVDSKWVYWVTLDGRLWHVAKTGGTPSLIAGAGTSPSYRLVVASQGIFWEADGGIFHVDFDGGQEALLYASATPGFAQQFTAGATSLYWSDDNNIRGMPLSLDAGPLLRLSSHSGCCIEVSSSAVFWAPTLAPEIDSASPDLVTFNGAFASNVSPTATAIDTAFLYWATRPDAGTYSLQRQLLAPDASVPTVENLGSTALGGTAASMAVDAHAVYWVAHSASNGWVMTVPLDGGGVSCLQTGLSQPTQLTQDAQNLYWSDNEVNGMVFSLPKVP